MEAGQKDSRKERKRAERPLRLYALVQQHGLPQTSLGRAQLLGDAGYKSVALGGHRRRASLTPKNYREVLCFDPFVKAYVGTGSFLPEEDFNNILFNVFTRCYNTGKQAAKNCSNGLANAEKTPNTTLAPTFFRPFLPGVEEIVDDGEDRVPLCKEHGEAYRQARTEMGYC